MVIYLLIGFKYFAFSPVVCVKFGKLSHFYLYFRYGVPMDPSYLPEWSTRFTDEMTFVQRFQNVLSYAVMERLHLKTMNNYQQLKIKYNIKPEISILQSFRQAELIVFNMNFPLEYPRPLYPNMILSTPIIGW